MSMGARRKPFADEGMKLHDKKSAMRDMELLVKECRKQEIKEKSFHLYEDETHWHMYADSMKDTAVGKHIKEFEV